MRMVKRFGLVLMVLALLVSFAGSAMAADYYTLTLTSSDLVNAPVKVSYPANPGNSGTIYLKSSDVRTSNHRLSGLRCSSV